MKKTTNAQNWTGEKLNYEKTSTGIEVYDMKFKIEKLPEIDDIPELERYQVTDENGITFEMDRWSEDEPFMASSNGIVREGYEADEVAAAMVANLY
jgi:hypothetical protein